LSVSVLVPNVFYGIGMGAATPMVPLAATELGASLPVAALLAALLMIGQFAGTIPAGRSVERFGERPTMVASACFGVVGATLCAVADSTAVLGIGAFAIGVGAGVFGLARHAFVTVMTPPGSRGRALSMVAGSYRIGFMVGPFLSAAVIHLTHSPAAAFGVVMATSGLLATAVLVVRGPASPGAGGAAGSASSALRLREVLWQSRGVLARVGTGVMTIGILRTSRQIVVPLWALHLDITEVHIALIVGSAAAVDVALFYLGGVIMDRWGRLWVAVPTLAIFAAAHVGLALSMFLPGRVPTFLTMVALMAVANGISSGIMATIGSDLADPGHPGPFLSAWRTVTESGSAAAPLLIFAISSVASLSAALVAMGAIGFVGLGLLARHLPRTAPRRP
jgi:MFS family permease